MSSCIKIKRGHDLAIKGEAPSAVSATVAPATVAVCPDDFPGFTPKAAVKAGEEVSAGAPLLFDKNHPDVTLPSPVDGVVEDVVRGSRRKIERVVVRPVAIKAGAYAVDKSLPPAVRLAKSGLLACFRQRPYDIVPDPEVAPRDIFVTAFDSAPLAPQLIAQAGSPAELQAGVDLLASVTKGTIYIGVPAGTSLGLKNATEVCFKGPHPAGNAGVQANHIAPVNKGETIWTLDIVTLGRVGRFALSGKVDFDTTVALTGPELSAPATVKTLMGCDLPSLLAGHVKEDGRPKRYISGNVLTGCRVPADGYLRFPYRQVTVIAEGDDRDHFMGWASLSPSMMSVSRTFPSAFLPKRRLAPDALLNGAKRAMIMSGVYDRMIPMDILPEPLLKAILSRDIERMEALGIYEVAPEDFALAEWADPSKIELQRIVREGLDFMRREA